MRANSDWRQNFRLLQIKPGATEIGPYIITHGTGPRTQIEGMYLHVRRVMLMQGFPRTRLLESRCRRVAERWYKELIAECQADGFPKPILELFSADSKAEALKIARDLELRMDLLIAAQINARTERFNYKTMFRQFVPIDTHKVPPTALLDPKLRDESGRLKGDARKALGQVNRVFAERRHNSIHWFGRKNEWHCLYFSFEDIRDNHWKHGSHAHYISHVWGMERKDVWEALKEKNINLPSAHIRFLDEFPKDNAPHEPNLAPDE
jgi:hypothetical protein